MPLIFSLSLLFGFLFVIRTLHIFRARAVIGERVVTKTGTAFICGLICFAFWPREFQVCDVFLCVLAAFCPLLTFTLLEHARLEEFRARVPLFLDRWILGMRLGNSLSAARDAALREECENFRRLLAPVFGARPEECDGHVLLAPEVLRELVDLARATHAQLARLENLRAGVRRAAEFRRKSGQAVRQTAIQSSVMLVLLFALAAFTVRRYGWTRSGDLVAISALLSLFGVALMFRLARKTQWKL